MAEIGWDRGRRRRPHRLRHVAGCDYLITTDDRMLKFVDHRIKVISPTDVIYLMEV